MIDSGAGAGVEQKDALEFASLDSALLGSWERRSWSPVSVSLLGHHQLWGQTSSETRGLPKDVRHGLPGRPAAWQRQAS